ncbi:hypothetical protein P7C70_g5990, partial [Phenoliferia sp. Uapishka_3]
MQPVNRLAKSVLNLTWDQHVSAETTSPPVAFPPSPPLDFPTPPPVPQILPLVTLRQLSECQRFVVMQTRLLLHSLVHLSPAVQVVLHTLSKDPTKYKDLITPLPPFLDILPSLTFEEVDNLLIAYGAGPEPIVVEIPPHDMYSRSESSPPVLRTAVFLRMEHIKAAAALLADNMHSNETDWKIMYFRHIIFIFQNLFHEACHWYRSVHPTHFHSPPRYRTSNSLSLGSSSGPWLPSPNVTVVDLDTTIKVPSGEAGAWGEDCLGGKMGRWTEGLPDWNKEYRIAKLIIRQPGADITSCGDVFIVPDEQLLAMMSLLPDFHSLDIPTYIQSYSDEKFLRNLSSLDVSSFLPFRPNGALLDEATVAARVSEGYIKMREGSEGGDKQPLINGDLYQSILPHILLGASVDFAALATAPDLEEALRNLRSRHTSNKLKRLIEENGGIIAKDYTDVRLKRVILSSSLWSVPLCCARGSTAQYSLEPTFAFRSSFNRAAEGTTGKSLVVQQIKKANKDNLIVPEEDSDEVVTEEEKYQHRVWLLPLDWLLDSLELSEMQPEDDYDLEFQVEEVREKKRKEAAADRKRNGGKSKYGPGGRQAAMRAKEEKKAMKEFQAQEEREKRLGIAATGLDTASFATGPSIKPAPPSPSQKAALIAATAGSSFPLLLPVSPETDLVHLLCPAIVAKPKLAQSSLTFGASSKSQIPQEEDPWDVAQRRKDKNKNRGGGKDKKSTFETRSSAPAPPKATAVPAKAKIVDKSTSTSTSTTNKKSTSASASTSKKTTSSNSISISIPIPSKKVVAGGKSLERTNSKGRFAEKRNGVNLVRQSSKVLGKRPLMKEKSLGSIIISDSEDDNDVPIVRKKLKTHF